MFGRATNLFVYQYNPLHYMRTIKLLYIKLKSISAMLLKLYEKNNNPADLQQVIDLLNDGGILIYPCLLYTSRCV